MLAPYTFVRERFFPFGSQQVSLSGEKRFVFLLDLVEPIYPEKPKHPRQKYRLTEKGLDLIKNK